MEAEVIDKAVQYFGLDPATLLIFPALIVALISILKTFFNLAGKSIFFAAMIVSCLLSWYAYRPQLETIIAGSLIYLILSIGLWEAAKKLAHKAKSNNS